LTTGAVSASEESRRIQIRPRADDDWSALLDLWVASWRITFPEIDFDARRTWLTQQIGRLEAAGAQTLCLLETHPPALAGFVIIDPATGWLDQICVDPAHFGKGYGETLLSAARERSPRLVQLDVNAENHRAIRFYERNGFLKTGVGANPLSGRETVKMEWRPLS